MVKSFGYLGILVLAIVIGLIRSKKHDLTTPELIEHPTDEHWCCPQCHELVPYTFAECWNCGSEGEEPGIES